MNSENTSASTVTRETVTEPDAAGAVREALASNPGSTTAAIATAAGTGKKEARRELLALEKAGTATRAKGGKPGLPDTWTLTAAPDEPEAPAAEPEPQGADEAASGDEPRQGADDTAEPGEAADEAPQPPDPAAVAEATEQVVMIAKALADISTALAEGNIAAALDGIEQVREPAAQARRVLKAAAKGKRRPARSPGTGVRPGALRDLVQAHLYDNPGEEYTPHQISKTLGRSSGAVANALDRLVQLGVAAQTSEKPRRFQLRPDAPARPAPDDETAQPAAETTDNPDTEPATGTVTEPEPGDGTETGITADAA